MATSTILLTIAGWALIAATAWDVFATVLLGREADGLLAPRLNRAIWAASRAIDGALGCGGRVMALAGPTMLVTVIGLWALLLTAGFALVVWPMLGGAVTAGDGPTGSGFIDAFYFSGYTLTTLGLGPLIPRTDGARLLAVAEGAAGFSFFTLTVSYTLNIYSTVQQRDEFALLLDAGADGGGPTEALLGLLPNGEPASDVGSSLTGMADGVARLLEAHHAYRIAHYFRRRDPALAMPRILYQVLELVSLAEGQLRPDGNEALLRSRGFVALRRISRRAMEEVDRLIVPSSTGDALSGIEQTTAPSHRRLEERGAALRPFSDAEALIRRSRSDWAPALARLTHYMAYEPSRIVPDATVGGDRR